jgi:hypothetical protein
MLLSEEFMTGRVAAHETAERDRETELLRVIRAEHEARHDEGEKVGWVRRHRAAAAARAGSRRTVATEPASVPAAVPAGVSATVQGAASGPIAGAGDGAPEAVAPSASTERRELEPAGR